MAPYAGAAILALLASGIVAIGSSSDPPAAASVPDPTQDGGGAVPARAAADSVDDDGLRAETLRRASVRLGPHSLRRQALTARLIETARLPDGFGGGFGGGGGDPDAAFLARLLGLCRFFHRFHHQRMLLHCLPISHGVDTDRVYAACLETVVGLLRTPQDRSVFLSGFLGGAQFLPQDNLLRALYEQVHEFQRFGPLMTETIRGQRDRLVAAVPDHRPGPAPAAIMDAFALAVAVRDGWDETLAQFQLLNKVPIGDRCNERWTRRAHSFKKRLLLATDRFLQLVRRMQDVRDAGLCP